MMAEKKLRIGFLSDYLTSEYVDNLINGITSFCSENDIELIMFNVGDFHNTAPTFTNFEYASVVAHINSKNLDGLILASSALRHSIGEEEYRRILKDFEPLKMVNIASVVKDIPSIICDCDYAFDSLIQYLIDQQGCKKFALMGVESQTPEVLERTEIFNRVMLRNNIPLESVKYWKSRFDYSSAYAQLNDYRRAHGTIDFDAIVALNDEMAFACADFCSRRMHMSIPTDIVITGFDNVQRAAFYSPTLTSVNQQVEFIGYTAANTLYKQLKNKEVPLLQKIKAKTILRQSTARNRDAQKNFQGNNFISVDLRTARDFSSSFSVSEWYNKRSQILQAANYSNNINPNSKLEFVASGITSAFRSFGFQAAAVVLYDHPIETLEPFDYFTLPQKAYVLAGFDYEKVFNTVSCEKMVEFNPNEYLIPPQCLFFPSCGTICTALFQGYNQYGYLLLRCNNYDLGVYDLLQRSISNIIAASWSYTEMLNEQDKISSQNKKLDVIAHTDELTGLRNRRGFMEMGLQVLELSEQRGESGLVVFCDMDGLKFINDNYGHETGDIAIKAQADILNNTFRSNDILGRCGGDEFLLICPGLNLAKFGKIKERVAKACKEWTKDTKSKFELSISLGAVAYPDPLTGYKMESLLSHADELLYNEKREKKSRRSKLIK